MVKDLVIVPFPKHRRRKNSKHCYDIVCAFDIETTNLVDDEIAFCYSWAFNFGLDTCIVGRTIQSAIDFLSLLDYNLLS